MIKDEATYLPDWIAFHHLLGVRRFVLYDNGSTDDTRALLRPLEAERLVTMVDWRVFTDLVRPQAGTVTLTPGSQLRSFSDSVC